MKSATISLILITVTVSVFSLMIFRVIKQGERLTDNIATIEAERAQESSYFMLRKIAEESKEDREKLHGYFLAREGNSIDFLNTVESLAQQSGVVLETENLDTVTKKADNSEWIEVAFSFSTTKEKIIDFLQLLETLPYVSTVTDVNLSARTATDWSAEVTMQVRILSYE